jgi:hypothetical protein
MTIDLSQLALPFPADDIEWRVNRSGIGNRGIFCVVLAYVTARAIQQRLDDVCGPANWRVEEPRILSVNGKDAFAVGLSIRIEGEWIAKWDVADPTKVEPAKGGFSGGQKRSGAQWGIARYLYRLDETFAEVADTAPAVRSSQWHHAKLPEEFGRTVYWWKSPGLPAWALPKDPEHEITAEQLNDLKRAWRDKFAPDSKSPQDLREGFTRFVASVAGEFPSSDYTCWTRDALDRCATRITETTDPGGISADVPFGAAQ